MDPSALNLYVYYRIASENAELAQQAFERARAALGVTAQLLQRPPAVGDTELTWMEVYPPQAWDDEPAIARALAPWLIGERHAEWFTPLA